MRPTINEVLRSRCSAVCGKEAVFSGVASPQAMKTSAEIRSLLSVDFISYLSVWVEFSTRFILLNIPSALLVNFPELDRVSSIGFTYLSLQVVGYCWAFLVNAAFAISCQAASFLPFNQANEEATTLQLIASFYFAYASARVVISFAHHASYLGYQSLQDFPHIISLSKPLSDTLIMTSTTLFIPVVWIELSVLLAPDICSLNSKWAHLICQHTGLNFFTHSFPKLRKIMFFVCMLLVLQLWQGYLYQFPRWDRAIRASKLSRLSSLLFQSSMLLIAGATVLTLGGLFFSLYLPLIYERYLHLVWLPDPETWAWISLFGWTIWLLLFSRFVLLGSISVAGQQVETLKLQHLVKSLRLSQMIIYLLYFLFFSGTVGFLEAQLDCTLISIVVPSLIVIMCILVTTSLHMNSSLVSVGVPFCLLFSSLVCYHMTSRIGGHGSILLISLHAFGKIVQYFGSDPSSASDYEGEYEPWNEENDQSIGSNSSLPIKDKSTKKPSKKEKDPSANKIVDDLQLLGKKNRVGLRRRKKSISYDDLDTAKGGQSDNINQQQDHAKETFANRGSEHSSLVSVSLPSTVRTHWITALSSRTVGFSLHLARTLTMTDNLLAGIMRVGTAVGVIFTVLFGIISVLSVLQQNLNLFPKLITYHSSDETILLNHIISNVTLQKNPCRYSLSPRPPVVAEPNQSLTTCEWNDDDQLGSVKNLKKPMYASCSMRWKSLSVLDFAILSELSYFDDPLSSSSLATPTDDETNLNSTNSQQPTIQKMLDELFPDLDFIHIKASNAQSLPQESSGLEGAHPMYLEVHSEQLGLTVVAVRGTDVGRLHDFLEDVKLFAEPVLISLLSCIFPLMRVSSDTTTSMIIQILHESNSFFGLVGEAEYYQPLLERVKAISETPSLQQQQQEKKKEKNKRTDVILTGHSLGGGLSRIVAALAHLPSVSFAPPGIALSHRKFSILKEKEDHNDDDSGNPNPFPHDRHRKIRGMTDLHDQSMAVITDFDMIPYVDEQVGLIQKIMCDYSNKSHQNACHLLEGTICHLLQHCGDHRHRFLDCHYSFNFEALVPSLQHLLWKQRWILFPILAIISLMITLAVVPEIV